MLFVGRRPTYAQGHATCAGDSAFPELWRGLIGLFAPRLGKNSTTLRDYSPYATPGTLTAMEPDDWGPTVNLDGDMGLTLGGTDEYVAVPDHTRWVLTTNATVCADITFTSAVTEQGICFRGTSISRP